LRECFRVAIIIDDVTGRGKRRSPIRRTSRYRRPLLLPGSGHDIRLAAAATADPLGSLAW
jgi:hypothetical protein